MAKPGRKTHLPHWEKPGFTLCGEPIERPGAPLILIKRTQCVDEATCGRCSRADDALVVRNHRRECREAGIDPDTMEKLK